MKVVDQFLCVWDEEQIHYNERRRQLDGVASAAHPCWQIVELILVGLGDEGFGMFGIELVSMKCIRRNVFNLFIEIYIF